MSQSSYPVRRLLITSHASNELYELKVDHGFADISFDTIAKWLLIANLDVEPDFRRQGRAKALLGEAAVMATEFDARMVYAAIVSRESIDAFVSVFGPGAVLVDRLGTYDAPVGNAAATLKINR